MINYKIHKGILNKEYHGRYENVSTQINITGNDIFLDVEDMKKNLPVELQKDFSDEKEKLKNLTFNGLIDSTIGAIDSGLSIGEQFIMLENLYDKAIDLGVSSGVFNKIRYGYDKNENCYSGNASTVLNMEPNKDFPIISALILVHELSSIEVMKRHDKEYVAYNKLKAEVAEFDKIVQEAVPGGFVEEKKKSLDKDLAKAGKSARVLELNAMETLIKDYAKSIKLDDLVEKVQLGIGQVKTAKKIKIK